MIDTRYPELSVVRQCESESFHLLLEFSGQKILIFPVPECYSDKDNNNATPPKRGSSISKKKSI